MGIYIYIYIYIYVCHASAHALRMRKIIIITCTCNGSPWFFWYTAKVWHVAAFSCNLREASALMRISSILYKSIIIGREIFVIKNVSSILLSDEN